MIAVNFWWLEGLREIFPWSDVFQGLTLKTSNRRGVGRVRQKTLH